MKNQSVLTKPINPVSDSINRSLWRWAFLLGVLAVACFPLAPVTRAQCAQICNDALHATALGTGALVSDNAGGDNTAIGFEALHFDTSGFLNTASGSYALFGNTTGSYNTASSSFALASNTTGSYNTANGQGALFSNTTGSDNTASGVAALYSNSSGASNAASGAYSLYTNTTGNYNTATGYQALYSNTTGNNDAADGFEALFSNTTGSNNVADGYGALANNTIGNTNSALGENALLDNSSGSSNTAVGASALLNNSTGGANIAIGASAGINLTSGSNNIDIGNAGAAGESGVIRIGTSGSQAATFVAGIRGMPVSGGQPVAVSAIGQLGIRASSARFKESIRPMGNASEAILDLKPVSFRYKKALDPDGTPEFGLIAEEVARVAPDLVTTDEHGKPFTVRYDEVNAMLLNEFLKAHRQLEDQKAINAKLESKVVSQEKEIQALAVGLQKVSNQFELMKPAPRVVANNQ
jgi:trimeric autotransporter adhesin